MARRVAKKVLRHVPPLYAILRHPPVDPRDLTGLTDVPPWEVFAMVHPAGEKPVSHFCRVSTPVNLGLLVFVVLPAHTRIVTTLAHTNRGRIVDIIEPVPVTFVPPHEEQWSRGLVAHETIPYRFREPGSLFPSATTTPETPK
jgi:hypothetical protein